MVEVEVSNKEGVGEEAGQKLHEFDCGIVYVIVDVEDEEGVGCGVNLQTEEGVGRDKVRLLLEGPG